MTTYRKGRCKLPRFPRVDKKRPTRMVRLTPLSPGGAFSSRKENPARRRTTGRESRSPFQTGERFAPCAWRVRPRDREAQSREGATAPRPGRRAPATKRVSENSLMHRPRRSRRPRRTRRRTNRSGLCERALYGRDAKRLELGAVGNVDKLDERAIRDSDGLDFVAVDDIAGLPSDAVVPQRPRYAKTEADRHGFS